MAKSPQKQGIETRKDEGGREVAFRAYGRLPSTEKGKRGPMWRGPWRDALSEARSDRVKFLAAKDAGALADLTPEAALPTVAAAIDSFLDDADAGRTWARGGTRYARRTLDIYATDFRQFIVPALGAKRVDVVQRSDIQALVGEVNVLRGPQRARMVTGALGSLYRYLLERHDELTSPVAHINLPAAPPPRERVLMPSELVERLEALQKRTDRTFLAVCAMAGLRREEAARVLVEDIDLVSRTLAVRGVKRRGDNTGRVTRRLPIFDPLVPELEAQLATLDVGRPGQLLLPREGRSGRAVGLNLPVAVDQVMKRARRAWVGAGLETEETVGELVPHSFRHTFASHLVAAGYDVATVAKWIGHERATTTLEVYVKPLRDRGLSPAAVNAYLGRCPWDGYPTGYPTPPLAAE